MAIADRTVPYRTVPYRDRTVPYGQEVVQPTVGFLCQSVRTLDLDGAHLRATPPHTTTTLAHNTMEVQREIASRFASARATSACNRSETARRTTGGGPSGSSEAAPG